MSKQATVQIRRDPIFGEVKPEVAALDGTRVKVSFGWHFDDGECQAYREAGDAAWVVDEPRYFPVAWIATGDLVFEEPSPTNNKDESE